MIPLLLLLLLPLLLVPALAFIPLLYTWKCPNSIHPITRTLNLQSLGIGLHPDTDINTLATCIQSIGNIQTLDLRYNNLSTLDNTFLQYAPNLTFLLLSHNQINYIRPDTFINNTNLIYISLDNNALSTFQPNTFTPCYNLKYLYLANNKITALNYTFDGLSRLFYSDISNNLITDLFISQLGDLTNNTAMDLSGNPLRCLPSASQGLLIQAFFMGQIPTCNVRVSVQAKFLDYSSDSFEVVFSGTSIRCPYNSVSPPRINQVFDFALLDQLGGSDAYLVWTSADCSSFKVTLGKESWIQIDDFLLIRANSIMFYDSFRDSWEWWDGAAVQLEQADNPVILSGYLDSPAVVPSCVPFSITAVIQGLGGRLKDSYFFWSIQINHQEILSFNVRGNPVLNIEPQQLLLSSGNESVTTMAISVSIENWMGVQSTVFSKDISLFQSTQLAPVLQLSGPTYWDPILDDIIIDADITIDLCPSFVNDYARPIVLSTTILWNLSESIADENIMRNCSRLYIPRGLGSFEATDLLSFTVKVQLMLDNSILPVDLFGIHHVKTQSLLMDVVAPRIPVGDASPSWIYLPENFALEVDAGWQANAVSVSDIEFQWFSGCDGLLRPEMSLECYSTSGLPLGGQRSSAVQASGSSFWITSTSLGGILYRSLVLSLNVLQEDRLRQLSVGVTVIPANSLHTSMSITSESELQLDPFSSSPSYLVRKGAVIHLEAIGQPNSSFSWNCIEKFTKKPLTLTALMTSQDSSQISINSMDLNLSYTCKVLETDIAGNLGSAEVSFEVVSLRLSGKLAVSPRSGTAWNTTFQFNVSSWIESGFVSYDLVLVSDLNIEIQICKRCQKPVISTILPPGLWTPRLVVTDKMGFWNVLNFGPQNISVSETGTELEGMLNFLASAQMLPSYQRISSLLDMFISVKNSSDQIAQGVFNLWDTIQSIIAMPWEIEILLERFISVVSRQSFNLSCDDIASFYIELVERSRILMERQHNNAKLNNAHLYRLIEAASHEVRVIRCNNSTSASLISMMGKHLSTVPSLHHVDGSALFPNFSFSGKSSSQPVYIVKDSSLQKSTFLWNNKLLTTSFFTWFVRVPSHQLSRVLHFSISLSELESTSPKCGVFDPQSISWNFSHCTQSSSKESLICECKLVSGHHGVFFEVESVISPLESLIETPLVTVQLDLFRLFMSVFFFFGAIFSLCAFLIHCVSSVLSIRFKRSQQAFIPLKETITKQAVYMLITTLCVLRITLFLYEGSSLVKQSLIHWGSSVIYCLFLSFQTSMFVLWNYEVNEDLLSDSLPLMSQLKVVICSLNIICFIISAVMIGLSETPKLVSSVCTVLFVVISALMGCVFFSFAIAMWERLNAEMILLRLNPGPHVEDRERSFKSVKESFVQGTVYACLLQFIIFSWESASISSFASSWGLLYSMILSSVFELLMISLMFRLTGASTYWSFEDLLICVVQRCCLRKRVRRESDLTVRLHDG